MSRVTRFTFVLAVCAGLPACSSEMTRFDYPALGMNNGKSNEVQENSANNSYQNSDYQQSQQRSPDQYKYDQGRYNNDQYAQNRYSDNRDVYDTKSTLNNERSYDNRYETRSNYDQRQMKREQLPDISQQNRREEQYRAVEEKTNYTPKQQSYAVKKTSARGDEHVVAEGDTLYNISKRYDVSIREIRDANDLGGHDIKLGQRLTIPGLKKQSSSKSAKLSGQNSSNGLKAGDSYRVASGDTVYSIARRAGISPSELAEANGIDDHSQVRLGQELVIPGKGSKRKAVQVASIDKKAGLRSVANEPIKSMPVKKSSNSKIKSVDSGASKALAGDHRFMWPVGGRIVSQFGRQKSGTINDGVNLAVPTGTSVKASEGGVVAYAGSELKGYGNLVLVRHKNNWVSAYAHNSALLVKRGDKVKRGQVIAKSGKSGSVTQPQLHFELRRGSKPVNPMKYLAMK